MRLLVDDREVRLDRPTLAAAIAAGAADADARGLIVVEIKADGVPLDPATIENAPDLPGSVGEVHLITTSRARMGAEVLTAAQAALGDLAAAQRHVADLILATKLEAAASGLQEVLNVWQSAREAADQVCMLLGSDIQSLAMDAGVGDQAAPAIGDLATALGSLRSAVQAQDWSMLADVLTDELTDLTQRWRTLLGALAAHLNNDGG